MHGPAVGLDAVAGIVDGDVADAQDAAVGRLQGARVGDPAATVQSQRLARHVGIDRACVG